MSHYSLQGGALFLSEMSPLCGEELTNGVWNDQELSEKRVIALFCLHRNHVGMLKRPASTKMMLRHRSVHHRRERTTSTVLTMSAGGIKILLERAPSTKHTQGGPAYTWGSVPTDLEYTWDSFPTDLEVRRTVSRTRGPS